MICEKMKYRLNKDLKKLYLIKTPFCRPLFSLAGLVLRRCSFKRMNGIKVEKHKVNRADGTMLDVTLLTPLDAGDNLPLLLYLHGGAYVYKAAPYHYSLMSRYCSECQCLVLFVDYSLSPGKKYPLAVEEAVSAYKWALEELGVKRIAVMGDSAGGEIALSTVMRVLGGNLTRPSFLSLIYPVVAPIDTPSKAEFNNTPVWNAVLNRKMWRYYLGEKEYSSVFDYPRLFDFPPLYIETAEFDCLADEGRMLVSLLRKNGVSVLHNEVEGAPHGYDIALGAECTKRMTKKRIVYIKERFEENK